jgi:hypothetical protein
VSHGNPPFNSDERRILATALRLDDDEVMNPREGNFGMSIHFAELSMAGWIEFGWETPDGLVGHRPTTKLLGSPFAQELRDNPFGD